jgi:hypothetical protein
MIVPSLPFPSLPSLMHCIASVSPGNAGLSSYIYIICSYSIVISLHALAPSPPFVAS